MCAQSEGKKKDKAARPALARRQAARRKIEDRQLDRLTN